MIFVAHTSLTRNPIGGDALVDIAEALGIIEFLMVNHLRLLDVKLAFTKTTKEADATSKHFLETSQASIFNSTQEKITVLLTKEFFGKPVSSTGNAAVTTEHDLGTNLNYKNTIGWEITLQPGETKNVGHTYSFVRNSIDSNK